MITDIKRRALHRTKILQGQLKGIEKMIDNEDYCMDIITQTLAIQKSLGSLNKLIVENHLRTHIPEKLSSADKKQQAEATQELLDIYELTHNRSNGK
jgi:DNA-binding FrmR family transcriptional regulator